MRYVKLVDLPIYREGLGHLLDTQNSDGSWGEYGRYRRKYGELVNQAFYLHTTEVAVGALTAAFATPP